MTMSIVLSGSAFAANPFLDSKDDKPVSANFRGTEWNDENIQGEIRLTARVITTRVAKMREILPDYFIVTDDRIVLLNEENNDAAVEKISAMDRAPAFEEGDVRGISSGKLDHEEGPWTTKIEVKGDKCTYLATHNSGHFAKIVWKKGIGVIEYAMGYGAMADGFRLKRQR
jgi:hypothetical protein